MLEALLAQEIAFARRDQRKAQLTVLDFLVKELGVGWKGRARAIVDALRANVMRDPDHHSVRNANANRTEEDVPWVGAANDDKFIGTLLDFFGTTRIFPFDADEIGWSIRRRALHDLDIAIQQRFATNSCGDRALG